MNEIKISEMVEAEQVNDDDLVMIVQSGVNKKVKAEKIRARNSEGNLEEILKLVFPIR